MNKGTGRQEDIVNNQQ